MKELIMITRPENLEEIKAILDDVHCGGMTLSTVMGCGTQKGMDSDTSEVVEDLVNTIRGFKTTINLLPKIRVEVVVEDKYVESIITAVRDKCATDRAGDGKIFVRKIEDVIRIRTGEHGVKAL